MIQKIGPYNIISKIASGGMAAVYLAIHKDSSVKVAIKLLKEELQDKEKITDRFTQEGLLKLDHPNIVKVHSVGTYKKTPYIVMDYIEGSDLEEVIKSKGGLSIEKALNIFKQILSALSYVHSNRIIHRDIKPKNILIDKQGRVKLTDFGIAKTLYSNVKTSTGSYLGAPAYSSPEQMDGKEVDIRSDIYSLGITLYEMFAGKVPYSSSSIEQILKEKFLGSPIPITTYRKDLPQNIINIINKCIANNPKDRFDSIEKILKVISIKPFKNSNNYHNTIIKNNNRKEYRSEFIDNKKRKAKKKTLGVVFGVIGFIIIIIVIVLIISNIKNFKNEIATEESITIDYKNENLLEIKDIIASSYKIETGGQIDLSIDIENEIADLEIKWASKDGYFLQDDTINTKWIAPYLPGKYIITVSVSDDSGITDIAEMNVEVTEKTADLELEFLDEVYGLFEEYETLWNEMYAIHGEDEWYIEDSIEISREETFPPKLEKLSNKLKGFSYPESYEDDRDNLVKIADELYFYKIGVINCMKNSDYDGYLNYSEKFEATVDAFYDYYNKMSDAYNDKYGFE